MKQLDTDKVEYLAKRTLEQVCGYPVGRLRHRDCPDLQDDEGSYGIEVVEDCFENERAAETIITETFGKRYADIPECRIKALERYGSNIGVENGLIHSVRLNKNDNNTDHLLRIIEKKLKKLNSSHYAYFRKYGLYVSVESLILFDSNVKSVVIEVSKLDYPAKYSVLYLEQHFQLFVCNIEDGSIKKLPISQEDREKIRIGIRDYKR